MARGQTPAEVGLAGTELGATQATRGAGGHGIVKAGAQPHPSGGLRRLQGKVGSGPGGPGKTSGEVWLRGSERLRVCGSGGRSHGDESREAQTGREF